MSTLLPKQFIQKVLIEEVGEIHLKYPYISFLTMAVGIEFLGKALNNNSDWNQSGQSKLDFENAINHLNAFSSYRQLLQSHNFWTSFRNGFAHSFVPKNTISLSSKDEKEHFTNNNTPIINLRCEDFYEDFKNGCLEIIAMEFDENNKMNLPLLDIPDVNDINFSGSTN